MPAPTQAIRAALPALPPDRRPSSVNGFLGTLRGSPSPPATGLAGQSPAASHAIRPCRRGRRRRSRSSCLRSSSRLAFLRRHYPDQVQGVAPAVWVAPLSLRSESAQLPQLWECAYRDRNVNFAPAQLQRRVSV